ncbi:MAG: hypothetical protein ACE5OZ_15990 [Candidatus Heimdallarchaeota archaeon]
MDDIIRKLLRSESASIRFRTRVEILGEDPASESIQELQKEIKSSPRVKRLLSEQAKDGKIPYHPYAKWYGAHWVLASLADLRYPPGDETLVPLRDQVYDWLFSLKHEDKIKAIQGRVRRCASQEGNALYSLYALGLADKRTITLADRLQEWQWPDGGWNCDKRPAAHHSSFMESLIPLRGITLYAKRTGDKEAHRTAKQAAEIFLKRKVYKGQRNGEVIKPDFVMLHHPCYWHYDILFGLKVIAEAGFINDDRCSDALDLLEAKRLPDGGFPAEKKYYQVTDKIKSGRSLVNWGGTSKRRMNEFVTVDALYVLLAGGRLAQ